MVNTILAKRVNHIVTKGGQILFGQKGQSRVAFPALNLSRYSDNTKWRRWFIILASLRHTTSPSSNWKRSSISYPVLIYRTCLFDVNAIRTGNFPAEFRLELKTVRCKVTIVLTFSTNISTNRCAHTRAFLPFFLKLGRTLLKQKQVVYHWHTTCYKCDSVGVRTQDPRLRRALL